MTHLTPIKVAFLDRDNTLISDPGYNCNPTHIHFMPTVIAGLKRLQAAGFQLIIITNQSGIGRGYYSEADFKAFQSVLHARLAAEGISILADYFCPHLPSDKCDCRKPKPGLFSQAFQDWPIDRVHSVMIGDRPKDVLAAAAVGIRGTYVPVESEEWPVGEGPGVPVFACFDEAAGWACATS